jgi:hypothetical protein
MLKRTEVGSTALETRDRTLSVKQRVLLRMVNGENTRSELEKIFPDHGAETIMFLLDGGYIEPVVVRVEVAVTVTTTAPVHEQYLESMPEQSSTGQEVASVYVQVSSKNLAAFRMYLFDLIERCVAFHGPEVANAWRNRARYAQDHESLNVLAIDLVSWLRETSSVEFAQRIEGRISEFLNSA